jgi:hypothetical protein
MMYGKSVLLMKASLLTTEAVSRQTCLQESSSQQLSALVPASCLAQLKLFKHLQTL